MNPKAFFFLLSGEALSIALIDGVTKWLAQQQLSTPVEVLPFLHLELVHNDGLAWGVPATKFLALTLSLLALVAVLYLAVRMARRDSILAALAFGWIVGGGAANLIERAIFGFVTDFVKLGPIPNFNLADAAITLGALVLLLGHTRILLTDPATPTTPHA